MKVRTPNEIGDHELHAFVLDSLGAYGEAMINVSVVEPQWHIYTTDSEGDVGSCPSIAIDSNDKVHISYRDWTNGALKYATNRPPE